MMADPKYADLPGIAHDEPDVYETTDLPESEQPADFYVEENDIVERIHMSANDAFNKFKGKFLKANDVDFSDRIGKRLRTGYDACSGNWELAGSGGGDDGEKETPLQKYQRLKCEFNELLDDLTKLQNEKTTDIDYLIDIEQVQQTINKLNDLKIEETLGVDVVTNITDPQNGQIKKLLSQLEEFKMKIHEKPESQRIDDGNQDDKSIVYQLNYKPEHAKLNQTTRIAELESRLHRLESVIGSSQDKLSRLTASTKKDTLYETAQYLCATASLLDSSQLDHVEGRLAAVQQKMDAIAEKKKEIVQDEEKDKIILELYELVKSSEDITKLLPETVERLQALEALHTKAADFVTTLTQIEKIQTDISSKVEDNKTLLQGVQESFAMNLNEINQTVMNLDARIKALKKN